MLRKQSLTVMLASALVFSSVQGVPSVFAEGEDAPQHVVDILEQKRNALGTVQYAVMDATNKVSVDTVFKKDIRVFMDADILDNDSIRAEDKVYTYDVSLIKDAKQLRSVTESEAIAAGYKMMESAENENAKTLAYEAAITYNTVNYTPFAPTGKEGQIFDNVDIDGLKGQTIQVITVALDAETMKPINFGTDDEPEYVMGVQSIKRTDDVRQSVIVPMGVYQGTVAPTLYTSGHVGSFVEESYPTIEDATTFKVGDDESWVFQRTVLVDGYVVSEDKVSTANTLNDVYNRSALRFTSNEQPANPVNKHHVAFTVDGVTDAPSTDDTKPTTPPVSEDKPTTPPATEDTPQTTPPTTGDDNSSTGSETPPVTDNKEPDTSDDDGYSMSWTQADVVDAILKEAAFTRPYSNEWLGSRLAGLSIITTMSIYKDRMDDLIAFEEKNHALFAENNLIAVDTDGTLEMYYPKASTGGGTSSGSTNGGTSTPANCAELTELHPGGVAKSHPLYNEKLDRDGDGFACEPANSVSGSGSSTGTSDTGSTGALTMTQAELDALDWTHGNVVKRILVEGKFAAPYSQKWLQESLMRMKYDDVLNIYKNYLDALVTYEKTNNALFTDTNTLTFNRDTARFGVKQLDISEIPTSQDEVLAQQQKQETRPKLAQTSGGGVFSTNWFYNWLYK